MFSVLVSTRRVSAAGGRWATSNLFVVPHRGGGFLATPLGQLLDIQGVLIACGTAPMGIRPARFDGLGKSAGTYLFSRWRFWQRSTDPFMAAKLG